MSYVEFEPERLTPWGLLEGPQRDVARKSALESIAAARGGTEGTPEKIFETWLAEGRVNAYVDPRGVIPTLLIQCLVVPNAAEPIQDDLASWLAVSPTHFRLDSQSAMRLLRWNPEHEALRRRQVLADRAVLEARRAEADERRFEAEQKREHELESRRQRWMNVDPVVRALLRGHEDSALDAVFQALAAAYLKEPRRVDEQPPRRAHRALGISHHHVLDGEKE